MDRVGEGGGGERDQVGVGLRRTDGLSLRGRKGAGGIKSEEGRQLSCSCRLCCRRQWEPECHSQHKHSHCMLEQRVQSKSCQAAGMKSQQLPAVKRHSMVDVLRGPRAQKGLVCASAQCPHGTHAAADSFSKNENFYEH